MKVEQGQPEGFTPITITIETQEEADIMWAVFNYPCTESLLYSFDGKLDAKDHNLGHIHLEMWRAIDSIYQRYL